MASDAMLSIRRATPDDSPVLSALVDELRAHLGDPLGAMSADVIRRDGFGPDPAFEVLLAERGGVAVGYALFHPTYEPAYAARGLYLADLCVSSAARGTGIGRALLAAVVGEARRRGLVYVGWLSSPANQTAQDFYDHLKPDVKVTTISRVILVDPSYGPLGPAPAA
jgi:diamine N-acetyltransferase